MFSIRSVDKTLSPDIQNKIDRKIKPPGSLGQIEEIALQVALVQGTDTLSIQSPTHLLFAGDHGISSQGVSVAPSEVTTLMVSTFLAGSAAINCFCNSSGMDLKVIDAGIKQELPDTVGLIKQRLGAGTKDFSITSAMSMDTVQQGLLFGAKQIEELNQTGCNTVSFGEMGIGNTSTAAAIFCALTSSTADAAVGRGTGISDEQLAKKRQLVDDAMTLHQGKLNTPEEILSAVGGFEIVQMVGAMLKAAEHRMLVLIDGFICTAAAMLAVRMIPAARDYMVFSHQSGEGAHALMLQELEATPLFNLGMRLGEGTGSVLALPIIKAACSFYNDMASFEDLGIEL